MGMIDVLSQRSVPRSPGNSMIGLVLVTHGRLACEFRSALEHVVGPQRQIEAVMIEVPNPRHPFGARGVGEVPIVPPMAAVANAIADAIGIRMRDLPMSPPKLRAALDDETPRLAAE